MRQYLFIEEVWNFKGIRKKISKGRCPQCLGK
jgi:hypothetical protein